MVAIRLISVIALAYIAVCSTNDQETENFKRAFLNKLGLKSAPNVTSSRPVPDYMNYIYLNVRPTDDIEFDVAAYELKHIRTEGKLKQDKPRLTTSGYDIDLNIMLHQATVFC